MPEHQHGADGYHCLVAEPGHRFVYGDDPGKEKDAEEQHGRDLDGKDLEHEQHQRDENQRQHECYFEGHVYLHG